jgi:DNA (cytosine-5)-methyltransferase 1
MKFVDAFAGIGGFHLGVKQAIPRAECVLAIENDKHCQETYKVNFPTVDLAGDITQIKPEDIPRHDLFCAGFNCQPFSIAGKQLGFNDVRGNVFIDIILILEYHKPKYVILENVPQIKTHDNGRTFSAIYHHLKKIGYNPSSYILNSIDYGLAQHRKRCFIICGFDIIRFPNRSMPKPVGDIMFPSTLIHESQYIKLPFTQTSIKAIDIRKPLRVGYINQGRQGERVYSIQAPSITLTAQGGGIGGKTGLYMTDRGIRKLLPRECARAQGFPEWFAINCLDHQAYKQFGNAVSVNIVEDLVIQI